MKALRIEEFGKTSLSEFWEKVYELAKEVVPTYSSKYSKKKFIQHVVIICLKIGGNKNYERVTEMLVEGARIRDALNLDEVPHPSTICKAIKRLKSAA